ncbi:MAG: hypothetical protein NW205_08930 [Hyphomicrobiaceae bacterium]|nr:hypothetical protein [Hyphomicrobiaceae bacterium]
MPFGRGVRDGGGILLLLLLTALLLAGAPLAGATAAPGDRWVRIAVKPVNLAVREDLFDLTDVPGAFKAIRLHTRRVNLLITRMAISFDDGTSEASTAPIRLRRGGRSAELGGATDKFLDRLSLVYAGDDRAQGVAEIEIWGLQGLAGRSAKRPEAGRRTAGLAADLRPSDGRQDAAGGGVLGAVTVPPEAGQAEIPVPAAIGRFTRLRIAADGADFVTASLTVVYGGGGSEVLPAAGAIAAGRSGPWYAIDAQRFVEKVVVTFAEGTPRPGAGRIELAGDIAPDWLAADGQGARHNEGWVFVGARTAGFVGLDDALVAAIPESSGFSRLRLVVRGGTVSLNQVSLHHLGGPTRVVPISRRIADGGAHGPIDIDQTAGPLVEVRARHRSRRISDAALTAGPGILEVWARR